MSSPSKETKTQLVVESYKKLQAEFAQLERELEEFTSDKDPNSKYNLALKAKFNDKMPDPATEPLFKALNKLSVYKAQLDQLKERLTKAELDLIYMDKHASPLLKDMQAKYDNLLAKFKDADCKINDKVNDKIEKIKKGKHQIDFAQEPEVYNSSFYLNHFINMKKFVQDMQQSRDKHKFPEYYTPDFLNTILSSKSDKLDGLILISINARQEDYKKMLDSIDLNEYEHIERVLIKSYIELSEGINNRENMFKEKLVNFRKKLLAESINKDDDLDDEASDDEEQDKVESHFIDFLKQSTTAISEADAKDRSIFKDFEEFLKTRSNEYKASIFDSKFTDEQLTSLLSEFHNYNNNKLQRGMLFLSQYITTDKIEKYESNIISRINALETQFNKSEWQDPIRATHFAEENENRPKQNDLDAIIAWAIKIKNEIAPLEEKHKMQLKSLTDKLAPLTRKLDDQTMDIEERDKKLVELSLDLNDIQNHKINPKEGFELAVNGIKEKQKKLKDEIEILKKERDVTISAIEPLKKEIADLKKTQAAELKSSKNKDDLSWESLLNNINMQQYRGMDIEATLKKSLDIIDKIKGSGKTPLEYFKKLQSEMNLPLSTLNEKSIEFEQNVKEKRDVLRFELLKINLAKQQQLMVKEREFFSKLESTGNNNEPVVQFLADVQKLFYINEKLAIHNALSSQIINDIKNDNNKEKLVQLEQQLQQSILLQQNVLSKAINDSILSLNAEQQFNILCYLSANRFSDLNSKNSLMTKWVNDLSASHDKFPDYITPQKLNNLLATTAMDEKFIAHIKEDDNFKAYLNKLENTKGIKINNIQRVLFKTLMSMETPNKKDEFYNQFQNYLTPEALAQYQTKLEERFAQLEASKNRIPKQTYDNEMQSLNNDKRQFYEINKYLIDRQLSTLNNEFRAINSNVDGLSNIMNSIEQMKEINIRVNNLRSVIQKADSALNAFGAEPSMLKEQKKDLAKLISSLAKNDSELTSKIKESSGKDQFLLLCQTVAVNPTKFAAYNELMTNWLADMDNNKRTLPDYMTPQKLNILLSDPNNADKIMPHLRNRDELSFVRSAEGVRIENIERVLIKTFLSIESAQEKTEFYGKVKQYLTAEAVDKYKTSLNGKLTDLNTKKSTMSSQQYENEKSLLTKQLDQLQSLNVIRRSSVLNSSTSSLSETIRKSSNANTQSSTDLSDTSRSTTPTRKSTWLASKPVGTPPTIDTSGERRESNPGLSTAWKSTRSFSSRHPSDGSPGSDNAFSDSYNKPLPPTPQKDILDVFSNTAKSSDDLRSSGSQNSVGSKDSSSVRNSTTALQSSPELPTTPSPTRRSP